MFDPLLDEIYISEDVLLSSVHDWICTIFSTDVDLGKCQSHNSFDLSNDGHCYISSNDLAVCLISKDVVDVSVFCRESSKHF